MMNPFKKVSLLFLSLMMFSFASCELIEDYLPPKDNGTDLPVHDQAKLITDSTTTNTVWALQSVMLDGNDFTEQYIKFYDKKLYNSYLDIRTNGTFTGFLREDRYNASEGHQWELDGDTLHADHAYVVKKLTDTELVLERHEHYSVFKDNWSGDVMTYTFKKVKADEYYSHLLHTGEWILVNADIHSGSFNRYPFGMNQSMYLRKDSTFMGKFLFQSVGSADTPLAWSFNDDANTITIGNETYKILKATLDELLLVREGYIEYIDPVDKYRLTGTEMTFYFKAGEDTEFFEPQEAIGESIITDRWEVKSIGLEGRDITTPEDKEEQFLEINGNGTFSGQLIHYVWSTGTSEPNNWILRDDQLVLEQRGYPTKYFTITMVHETEMEMLITNDEGSVYTYLFKRK